MSGIELSMCLQKSNIWQNHASDIDFTYSDKLHILNVTLLHVQWQLDLFHKFIG